MCSPDCPQGMADLGQLCQKMHFSREKEVQPMICPESREQEGYMCYEPCGDNETGTHNVCWGQCPSGTNQCGVLCLSKGEQCTSYLSSIGKDTLTSVIAYEHQHMNRSMSNDMELAEIQEETYNN